MKSSTSLVPRPMLAPSQNVWRGEEPQSGHETSLQQGTSYRREFFLQLLLAVPTFVYSAKGKAEANKVDHSGRAVVCMC